MELIYLLVGLVIGGAAAWLAARARYASEGGGISSDRFHQLNAEKVRFEERSTTLARELEEARAELKQLRESDHHKGERLARAEEAFKSQEEKQKELERINERFTKEFENVAGRLLRQNSDEISKMNKERLSTTLDPLSKQIQEFREKIEQSGKDREGLKAEIKLLHELNQKMAEEASNLTKALKGDTKKQGSWGEIILERILERSGLVKDQEYQLQYSTQNAEGSRIQPDVIVFLPDDKHLIIDSKVSLTAYEKAINAEEEADRDRFSKEHILSIRAHIKSLSEKEYQTSKDLNTPDFVLLFMPIEAAFSVAIQYDQELFSDAWDKKIVIVSPTTLLATLRTISSVWRQERQTKNALEIARQSGALYDKFVGFMEDMESIGKHIDQTHRSYDDAVNKLSQGKGNLISRTEKLKKLGAKTSKAMPDKFMEDDAEEDKRLENE